MAILPAGQAKFEYVVDVVVIGGGGCGLTAALAASEAGATVLIVERDARPTGSTSLSTALIPAAGTKLQKAAGIEDSPELLASDILKKAKYQTDPEVVQAVARASGPTIEWLMEKHGLVLTLVEGFLYPGHSVRRMHGTPNRTGEELEGGLLAAAGKMQIDIVANAQATDLYATPEGGVTGVAFVRPNGAIEIIGCKAIVLACCGFGGNKDMVREYIPEMADAEFWGHVGNQGDAIRWGRELGAAVADLGSYQGHGGLATPYGNPIQWGVMTEGGFQVNTLGKRFSNEVRGYSEQAADVLAQPGRVAWDIFDEVREKPILSFKDYREVLSLGGIKKAPSITALAQLIGVPADALEKTVAEVTEMCAGTRTDPFGRDFSGKLPLKAPFCAVKVTGALFHTQGGLVVDANAQVLRANRSKLPNLFAGGGAARGFSGPAGWGYFSGAGLLTAIMLGRLAGTNAARVARVNAS